MFSKASVAAYEFRYAKNIVYRSTLLWKELRVHEFPEGMYVAVFCAKCQTKNRNYEGWRYVSETRTSKVHPLSFKSAVLSLQASDAVLHVRAEQASALRAMGPFGLALMGPVSQLHYQCERCRDDAPAAVESDSDGDLESDMDTTWVTMTGGSASTQPKLEGHHMTTRSQARAASLKAAATDSTSTS